MSEQVEEPEAQAAEAAGPDAGVAAVLAAALGRRAAGGGAGDGAGAAASDPELDAYLREQARVARIQAEHLHEQRELQLEHLKVRRWKDRIALALQALGGLAGAALLIGAASMVWQAHED